MGGHTRCLRHVCDDGVLNKRLEARFHTRGRDHQRVLGSGCHTTTPRQISSRNPHGELLDTLALELFLQYCK